MNVREVRNSGGLGGRMAYNLYAVQVEHRETTKTYVHQRSENHPPILFNIN